MDFHIYTTMRDWNRAGRPRRPPCPGHGPVLQAGDHRGPENGFRPMSMHNERDWEKARRPYYNMWPSIIPMLTRLNLDIDSGLIQLPLPALCIRFPKDAAKNSLKFEWKGEE